MTTKILYFEGAGMDFYSEEQTKYSDVGNFRIRTAFKNLEGTEYYIEFGRGIRREKNSKGKFIVISEWGLHIDYLFSFEDQRKRNAAIQYNNDLYNQYREGKITYAEYTNRKVVELPYNRKLDYDEIIQNDYTKKDITKWINKNLNCDFDTIDVLDKFYGYRVHGQHGQYNLIDDHKIDHELTKRRRKAYSEIDMTYKKLLNEKHSKISLIDMDDKSITIRCYASDEQLGDIPRVQTVMV